MRVVIQRVTHASVAVNGAVVGNIGQGLMVLVSFTEGDDAMDCNWLCQKIVQLRIFDDDAGIPNRSVKEINGEVLLISQFTLHAATKKGNRPSYIRASPPHVALPMYQQMIIQLNALLGREIATGSFGANMQVSLVNNGPITIIIDTKNKDF